MTDTPSNTNLADRLTPIDSGDDHGTRQAAAEWVTQLLAETPTAELRPLLSILAELRHAGSRPPGARPVVRALLRWWALRMYLGLCNSHPAWSKRRVLRFILTESREACKAFVPGETTVRRWAATFLDCELNDDIACNINRSGRPRKE